MERRSGCRSNASESVPCIGALAAVPTAATPYIAERQWQAMQRRLNSVPGASPLDAVARTANEIRLSVRCQHLACSAAVISGVISGSDVPSFGTRSTEARPTVKSRAPPLPSPPGMAGVAFGGGTSVGCRAPPCTGLSLMAAMNDDRSVMSRGVRPSAQRPTCDVTVDVDRAIVHRLVLGVSAHQSSSGATCTGCEGVGLCCLREALAASTGPQMQRTDGSKSSERSSLRSSATASTAPLPEPTAVRANVVGAPSALSHAHLATSEEVA